MNEVDWITALIAHPAGYSVDLFGLLEVYRNDDGWYIVERSMTNFDLQAFRQPEEAAAAFVELRHELQIGEDIERKVLNEEGNN